MNIITIILRNIPVVLAAAVWTLLPAMIFGIQLVERYDRELGAYVFDPGSFSEGLAWLREPEFTLLYKIAIYRIGVTLIVAVASSLTTLAMIVFMPFEGVVLAAIFTVVGFFVPPIVKAYAWEQLFGNISLWDRFGLFVYAWSAFFGFFLASMVVRVQGASLSALRGMRESFPPPRMMLELAKICCWPIIFATLCTFSLLFFSGDELRRFGDISIFNQVLSSIDPGRHRITAFVCIICIFESLAAAWISLIVLTHFLRLRFR